MKIAVISDIHGNLEAIEAVMADIQNNGCEKVFVLGDYAMAGPEPNYAIDFFMGKQSNPNFTMIQGNTDLMLVNYTTQLYQALSSKAQVMAEALKSDAQLLNPMQKEFLKNLPIQKEVEVEGVKILLVHGSPRKNNEDILPDTPLTEVEKMLTNVDAQVVLCGHTHVPCGFQTQSKKTVVNVGSIGRPFFVQEGQKPKSCYLIMTIENGVYSFEHRFVDYNREQAASKLLARDYEGAEKLAGMLKNPKERHF